MRTKLRNSSKVLAVGLALAFTGSVAQAAVTYVEDTSTVDNIPGLTGFSTNGAQMSGMTVNAIFSGGINETRSWATTGASSGGVTGTGWSLSLAGDSFGTSWNFGITATAFSLGNLTRLVLNGIPGLTVFDRTFGGGSGTVGSARGWDFEITSGFSGDATATYSNVVAIAPDNFVGDLFHLLTIDFGDNGPSANFSFIQDTDNDSRLNGVPEPASLALMGLGLAGLAAIRRRKQV